MQADQQHMGASTYRNMASLSTANPRGDCSSDWRENPEVGF